MHNVPHPDVDRLVRGGQVRRRRRTQARIGIVAASVVLVAGGVYGVLQVDRGTAASPDVAGRPTATPDPETVPQPLPTDNSGVLQPGVPYWMLVGVAGTGASIHADLTVDGPGWHGGNFPVVTQGGYYGGVAVYRPLALAAGSGCLDDQPSMDIGGTSQALAQQLTELPRSTVVQPPVQVQAFGHDALYLQVRIVDQCSKRGEGYRVAETHRGSHGISYTARGYAAEVLIDFWVVDLDGTTVVVDTWHQVDASSELVERIAGTRDSITFTRGE